MHISPNGRYLLALFTHPAREHRQFAQRSLYWYFPCYLEAYGQPNENYDRKFRSRPVSV